LAISFALRALVARAVLRGRASSSWCVLVVVLVAVRAGTRSDSLAASPQV
jgi:hypothetical protein